MLTSPATEFDSDPIGSPSFPTLPAPSALLRVGFFVFVKRKPPMPIGTVKFFNPDKGYGFISPEDGGGDSFVHISAVERAGMRTLDKDQRVKYELETDRRGKTSAVNLESVWFPGRGEASLPLDGRIDEILPGGRFGVMLENGRRIIAHTTGKMRGLRHLSVVGDRVIGRVAAQKMSCLS
jgi:CspA family cold shock protein